jgi:serine protease Do
VILSVNRKPVEDAQSCVAAIHAAPQDKDILLLVWANGGTTFLVIHPDQDLQNGM